jgi:hypothetical protein
MVSGLGGRFVRSNLENGFTFITLQVNGEEEKVERKVKVEVEDEDEGNEFLRLQKAGW